MNCKNVSPLIADYLTGNLDQPIREQLDLHVSSCAKCREELTSTRQVWNGLSSLPKATPSAALDLRIQGLIEGYREGISQPERNPQAPRGGTHWLDWIWPRNSAPRFAMALALLAVGSLLGFALGRPGPNSSTSVPKGDPAIAQLRDEVSSMKQLVMLSLLQHQSASDRLQGIGWSHRIEHADDRVFTALLSALDSDPNINVRLAAVDALHQFASDATVRKGLLHSLSAQQSPLVQIELINVLVELKDKESMPALNDLLRDPALDPSVRERAEWGLKTLG